MVNGFRVKRGSKEEMSVSHLLFTDDAILFGEAFAENLLHIPLVLMCFGTVTGLRVNLSKSELDPMGAMDNAEYLADLLCYKVGYFPLVNLGMPLGSRCKFTAVWNVVLERL